MSECTHFAALPEEGDYSVFKLAVFNALANVPQAIKECMIKAGFNDVRVSKIIHHPVYEIVLRRGDAIANDTETQVRQRIRRSLKQKGLYKDAKTTSLVVCASSKRIVCAFYDSDRREFF